MEVWANGGISCAFYVEILGQVNHNCICKCKSCSVNTEFNPYGGVIAEFIFNCSFNTELPKCSVNTDPALYDTLCGQHKLTEGCTDRPVETSP